MNKHSTTITIKTDAYYINVVNLYFIAWAGQGPQPTNNNIIYNKSDNK